MAKYPVESDDSPGVIDALNYLLSGPAGLGQYFSGFSTYDVGYLTGNYRKPFTQTTPAELYVAPIAISTITMLDSRTFKVTFASTQASVPFSPGQGPSIYDNSNDFYNGSWVTIGIVNCTVDDVTIRMTDIVDPLQPDGTGGFIYLTTTGNFYNSTDCDVRVVVTGGTDRVFVSGQLDNTISYILRTTDPADMRYIIALNRYVGSLNNDPTNPEYLFTPDKTVAIREYDYYGLTTDGTLPMVDTIFSNFMDQPPPGYYRYIIDVKFRNPVGDLEITQAKFGLRTITAQVVKQ